MLNEQHHQHKHQSNPIQSDRIEWYRMEHAACVRGMAAQYTMRYAMDTKRQMNRIQQYNERKRVDNIDFNPLCSTIVRLGVFFIAYSRFCRVIFFFARSFAHSLVRTVKFKFVCHWVSNPWIISLNISEYPQSSTGQKVNFMNDNNGHE